MPVQREIGEKIVYKKGITDPFKDIASSFQSLQKLISCMSADEVRRYQDREKQRKRFLADVIAQEAEYQNPLKDLRSSFQSLQKQLKNSFKLPNITTKSDLTGLTEVSKELKDPFGLKEVIGKSPLVRFSKMYKQVSLFDQILKPIPGVSDQSFLSTLPSLDFPNIIIPRPVDNSIFPLVPEEHHTPPPNSDSTTITDGVYEERIPSEQHSVPLPDIDRTKISYKVLIVGGFVDDTSQIVARFIEQLGFEAIILSEQPNGGRTGFEKFKAYTNVDFAITLLTPDDVGRAKDNPYDELKPRPSQDTIFGLGYLCNHLRPEQMCTLYTEKIELPSYLEGWIHVPMHCSGWKLKLVQEMHFAGLLIDKNKILL